MRKDALRDILKAWNRAVSDFRLGLDPQFQDLRALQAFALCEPWKVAGGA